MYVQEIRVNGFGRLKSQSIGLGSKVRPNRSPVGWNLFCGLEPSDAMDLMRGIEQCCRGPAFAASVRAESMLTGEMRLLLQASIPWDRFPGQSLRSQHVQCGLRWSPEYQAIQPVYDGSPGDHQRTREGPWTPGPARWFVTRVAAGSIADHSLEGFVAVVDARLRACYGDHSLVRSLRYDGLECRLPGLVLLETFDLEGIESHAVSQGLVHRFPCVQFLVAAKDSASALKRSSVWHVERSSSGILLTI